MSSRKSNFVKQVSRIRRGKRTRCKIKELGVPRLVVYRTPRHMYAQIIVGGEVLFAASTIDKIYKSDASLPAGNVGASVVIGKRVAEMATIAGITKVAFDRSGFKYHGRIKALADAAREAGLQF
jgi:large subunit ribosomal protein L18